MTSPAILPIAGGRGSSRSSVQRKSDSIPDRDDLENPGAADQQAGVADHAPQRRIPLTDDHGVGEAERPDPGPADHRGAQALAAAHPGWPGFHSCWRDQSVIRFQTSCGSARDVHLRRDPEGAARAVPRRSCVITTVVGAEPR